MEIIDSLTAGLQTVVTPTNLWWCLVGVMLGTLVGLIPGLGPTTAITFLLPLGYYVADPTGTMIMLAGIFYGAMYGGSTTAILLKLPGEAASTITVIDGYRMAQRNRAGVALSMAAVASFVAGTLTVISMAIFSEPLSQLAINFGPSEYTSLMILGLALSSALVMGSSLKGMVMVLLGSLLGFVGIDLQTGNERFTFGIAELYDGIPLIVLLLAFYGVSELVMDWLSSQPQDRPISAPQGWRSYWPTRHDIRYGGPAMLRGTVIGNLLGCLPGGGAVISAMAAYIVEKKLGSRRQLIGTGIVEGVAAPEAANNAAAQSSFVPFLILGIPTHSVMALMAGAMLIQGINPGPAFINQHADVFWALIASFWIGNLMLLLINLPMLRISTMLLRIPRCWIHSLILCACVISTYYINYSVFDVVLLFCLSCLAVILRYFDCEANPLIMGFLITKLLEEHSRRAFIIADGNWTFFVQSGFSIGAYVLTALLLVYMLIKGKG